MQVMGGTAPRIHTVYITVIRLVGDMQTCRFILHRNGETLEKQIPWKLMLLRNHAKPHNLTEFPVSLWQGRKEPKLVNPVEVLFPRQ